MRPNNRLTKHKLYEWLKKNCPEILLEDMDELFKIYKADTDQAYLLGYHDGFNDRGMQC